MHGGKRCRDCVRGCLHCKHPLGFSHIDCTQESEAIALTEMAGYGMAACLIYAALAGAFTWMITALGAAVVFLTRRFSAGAMDRMLGFGAGVMLASCFWSLLAPGIARAEELHLHAWFTAMLGLVFGGGAIFLGEQCSRRLLGAETASAKRCRLLIASITLHNIPEGLAVGVAFGALAAGNAASSWTGACMLALGIGLQNFPEGAAVSLPLRREGMSPAKSFFYGQLSGFVEPVSAVLGALLAASLSYALPFLLCFAAGAMLWVLFTELIPESQSSPAHVPVTWWTLIGFTFMMILDVAL